MMVAEGSASRMALAVASASVVYLGGVRFGPPKTAVRFVVDFPHDMPASKMNRRRRRPAREGGHALGMAGRGHMLFRRWFSDRAPGIHHRLI